MEDDININLFSNIELNLNQTDAEDLVCVQYLAALNSHLGGEKMFQKTL